MCLNRKLIQSYFLIITFIIGFSSSNLFNWSLLLFSLNYQLHKMIHLKTIESSDYIPKLAMYWESTWHLNDNHLLSSQVIYNIILNEEILIWPRFIVIKWTCSMKFPLLPSIKSFKFLEIIRFLIANKGFIKNLTFTRSFNMSLAELITRKRGKRSFVVF